MDEKLKREIMQKKNSFLCLCYILRAIRASRLACVKKGAMLATYLFRCTSECSAPFRSQILKILFALCGKGVLTPNQNSADVPEPTYIHTYIQTLDNAHNSQAQGLNLRCGWLLGGKRRVDINDEQMDGFLDEI